MGELPPGANEGFRTLFLHIGLVDRQIDLVAIAARQDFEQPNLMIERVERPLCARFKREAGEIGAGPVEAQDRLVALGILELLEAAEHRIAAFGAEAVAFEPVALAPGGEPDQLDRSAGKRPGDISTKLEYRIVKVLQ